MKFSVRYKLMNGGALMLCRRFLGMWFDYQPHRNRVHEVQAKMNTKVAELKELNDERRRLMAEETLAKSQVAESRECQAGYGIAFLTKLPLFPWRHKETPPPPRDWEPHARIFAGKSGSSLAERSVAAGQGNIVSVDGHIVMSSEDSDGNSGEFIGDHAWDLNPRRNNNKRKGNGNNNNQNNNNQNGQHNN